MALRLVAVGRVKRGGVRDACEEYVRRIQRYDSFSVDEVKDAGRPESEAARARRIEGEAILRTVADTDVAVALTRTGVAVSTEELAGRLQDWRDAARGATFIIGGAFGLGEDVLGRANWCLSLSAFTLPHDIARLVLLEQLYRAHTVMRGEPYHKGGGR